MAYRPVPYPRALKDAAGNVRIVQNHLQEQDITGVPMHESGVPLGQELAAEAEATESAKKAEYRPVPYPRAIKDRHGNRMTVGSHLEETYHTGIKMNEDGTPAEEEAGKDFRVDPSDAKKAAALFSGDPGTEIDQKLLAVKKKSVDGQTKPKPAEPAKEAVDPLA